MLLNDDQLDFIDENPESAVFELLALQLAYDRDFRLLETVIFAETGERLPFLSAK